MLEGVYTGIEDGWFQGRIADAAYDLERRIQSGRRVVVGVNRFTEGSDVDELEILQITPEDEERQLKRLAESGPSGIRRPWPPPSTASGRRRRDRGEPGSALVEAVKTLRQPGRGHRRTGRRLRSVRRKTRSVISSAGLRGLPPACERRAPGREVVGWVTDDTGETPMRRRGTTASSAYELDDWAVEARAARPAADESGHRSRLGGGHPRGPRRGRGRWTC